VSLRLFSQVYIIGDDTIHQINGNYFFINGQDTIRIDNQTVVVRFIGSATDEQKNDFERTRNIIKNYTSVGDFFHYFIPDGLNYVDVCNSIISDPIVSSMEINVMVKLYSFIPNDPDLNEYGMWYLQKIAVFDAWDITTGWDGITIGVLDEAFSWDHTDIGEMINGGITNIFQNPGEDEWNPWNAPWSGNPYDDDQNGYLNDWKGWDFLEWVGPPQFSIEDNDVRPEYSWAWHGTAVSSIICAKTNNSSYGAGIAGGNILNESGGVKLLPIKLADWRYNSYFEEWELEFSTDEIPSAIDYAVSLGTKVINMSFGVNPGYQTYAAIEDAIEDAYLNYNVNFVAAVGNENHGFISFPARNEYVIGVGGSTIDDERWDDGPLWGSNYGDEIDMVAPGKDIYILTGINGDTEIDGTSVSTAMVSATIGLMLSVNPSLTNEEITEILHNTSDKVGYYPYTDGWNQYMGFGRLNTCKAVSMAMQHNEPVTITSTTTWNDVKMFNNDVIIAPQCTLTIKNTVYMGTYLDEFGEVQKAKLIVKCGEDPPGTINDKSGGTLIIDGGKITSLNTCGENMGLWAGVEVWGMNQKSQYIQSGKYWQGKIELKNGGIIENAEKGVLLGHKTGVDEYSNDIFDDSKNGGIIQVANNGNPDVQTCTFLNNRTGIYFRNYRNYIPNTNPTQYCDNLSYLNNCLFDVNTDYPEGGWWFEHIYGYRVYGIKIKGCTFDNNKTLHNGHGINAYTAGFKVENVCNSLIQPCPVEYTDSCVFRNFAKAINMLAGGTYTLSVKYTRFINNSKGIALNDVDNDVILFNTFEIGEKYGEECAGYGIDMTNCTGFAIEENEFSKFQGAPNETYIGIRVNNCRSTHDIIYKNQFNGLSYGNYAQGINRLNPNDDQHGVEYQCNLNTNNSIDFIVTDNDPYSAKIRTFQGLANLASGNTFSSSAAWHYRNEGYENINYYFWNGSPNEIPDMQRVYSIGGLYFDDVEANRNTCPSHYGGGGGGTGGRTLLTNEEKLEREQAYSQNLSDYQNVKALFDNLKDGGNTEALQAEVETSWPSDMWELRAELLGKSPHLSKEVLMTAADKTDVLPESVLFEILAANPDELKEADLIKYLGEKDQPLPQYMIDILQQLSFGVTYKTILKRQMADYHAGKTQAALDMIRSILADTITDMQQYRNWLDNLGDIEADKQIIASYLSEGNYTDAQTLLNLMPSLYELDGQALMDYNDYKSLMLMQLNLEQQGRNICELDSTEVVVLVDYAENSAGEAKYMARGILNFAYGFNYCDCIVNSDSSFMKSSKIFPSKSFDMMFGSEVTVKPNPACEWTTFNYKLPDNSSEGIIEITDVSGAIIERLTITGKEEQKVWDTRKIKSGVYFYSLNVSGNNKTGKIVICK